MEERRQVLIEKGSESDNQRFLLIRVGNQILFTASSLDREIGRFDTVEADFTVDEFRRAVEVLKNEGTSFLKGEGFLSASFKRSENGMIEVRFSQYGCSFWFQTLLESLELED